MTTDAPITPAVTIAQLGQYLGQTVTLTAWITDKSGKGKLQFLKLRDGS